MATDTIQLTAIIKQQNKVIEQMNSTFNQYFIDGKWQREEAQLYYSYLADSLLFLMEMQVRLERFIDSYNKKVIV